uniref:Uncharacterized protein n=1 Tax=Anopheles minimus TaxID=112268 RepID=A0A182WN31_9DIPT
ARKICQTSGEGHVETWERRLPSSKNGLNRCACMNVCVSRQRTKQRQRYFCKQIKIAFSKVRMMT